MTFFCNEWTANFPIFGRQKIYSPNYWCWSIISCPKMYLSKSAYAYYLSPFCNSRFLVKPCVSSVLPWFSSSHLFQKTTFGDNGTVFLNAKLLYTRLSCHPLNSFKTLKHWSQPVTSPIISSLSSFLLPTFHENSPINADKQTYWDKA